MHPRAPLRQRFIIATLGLGGELFAALDGIGGGAILGGALVDLAMRDSNAAAMIERLIRNLPREQDRKAFEGWNAKPPAAPSPEAAVSSSAAPSPAPPSGAA